MGCTATNQPAETTASTEPQAITEAASDRQCFRNEYPFEDNPEQKDVESLTVDIQGDQVTGEYNWTPALKDARTGSFNGSINDDVITADYEYMQEGQSGETDITIRLEPEQAVVEGGAPELGLSTAIARVDC
ncbi:MAG: hypothetical protein F6J95_019220 [Leptolyngbya sp. SIO1E4]|nr:hypothetical protein [Leptolyngbya sp. SIO1E4]